MSTLYWMLKTVVGSTYRVCGAQKAVALVGHRAIVGPPGGGGLALPGTSLDPQRIPPQARTTQRRRAGIMPDVARTLDLPSGQRFEYWKHVLSNTFVPLEVWSPGGEDDFRGLLRGCELGSLRFIEVSAEAHTARRTARLVKAAPAGCYKIGLQVRGSSVLIQDGREATLTPGDFTSRSSGVRWRARRAAPGNVSMAA
jgi:hypothetical protein